MPHSIDEAEARRLHARYESEGLSLLDLSLDEPYSTGTIQQAFERFDLPRRRRGAKTGAHYGNTRHQVDGIKGKKDAPVKSVGTKASYRGHRRRNKY